MAPRHIARSAFVARESWTTLSTMRRDPRKKQEFIEDRPEAIRARHEWVDQEMVAKQMLLVLQR